RIVKADSYIALTSFNVQGSPINATLMSGDNITFWLIWRSEYGEDLTDPVIESHNATVILIDTPGMGIHSFNHTGGDVGIVTFNLTFGTTYYNSINYTMRFLITDRGLVIAKEPLTTHYSNTTHPYISPTGYLHYGDRYYFYVFINDSITASPLDINEADISTSINVTFVNVSSGRHLFYYDAWIIARIVSHQISIQFNKVNYVSVNYQISFFVDYADSEILFNPSSLNTYYSQNAYFSVVWQSIPNSGISTTLLRINSTDINISESMVTFIGVNNGNYTFLITSNVVDVFSVRIDFHSSEFIDQFFIFQLTILPVPTYLGGLTSPLNASVIGDTSLLYFSHIYEFTVQWLDDFNDSGIVDSSILVSGSGMNYLSPNYQTSSDGNHQLTYHANATGTYQVIIVLETTNFAKLVYEITFIVTIMPTNALNPANIDFNESILVEDVLYINGSGFKTFDNESISTIDSISLWLNDSSVPEVEFEFLSLDNQFWVNFSTQGYQWGAYNVSVMLEAIGYQSQSISFTVTLLGREINLTVSLPVATIEQGQSIEITAILEYAQIVTAGIGAELSLATLAGVDITFYIGLNYQNGSTKNFETITQTDVLGEASYMIDGTYTKAATGFANITVTSASFSSGLPARYSMSEEELAQYKITYFLDPFEILIPAAIIFTVIGVLIGSVYTINRRRKRKIETRLRGERKVEQSFEDIKSIRLIIARHESGLQFYSEKTIADLTTDTDALSGMSAAISSFMEEVSDSMASRSGEEKRHEIEMMSREGLHMLIWHGNYSSLIIISEVRLPDYFQDRLRGLGLELEKKYVDDLKNFYSSDQIPSSVVKKMVRKFIPLHYFSAFILNEGVLTLESIKLTTKQKKMLKQMKEIRFLKEGIQFFFSEQIISQLSKHWKRSEAIKFLNQAIEWNLLIEASQEDIINIQK
ncbi:MAG: hypothetical protein ACFFAU_13705, partial [Candidatus Hodarchaeota archaeon]